MSQPAHIQQRAAGIGERALRFTGIARDAFIQVLCQEDQELTKVVRQYIARPKQALRSNLSAVLATVDSRQKVRHLPVRVLQNRYEVRRYLGAGGMGQVFEAFDLRTANSVAIKLLKPEGAFAQDQRMRFVREARSAGRLRHPNIVEVYDIGQIEANLYIVMEYVEGPSLGKVIVNRPQIFVRSMLLIMSQVANALAFAHSKGVIHGDIKPDNIMVRADGSAKLLDFGLAQQIGLPNSLVRGAGTPAYMAPEIFQQQDADEASDIWSLGVALFECLTGKLPFVTLNEVVSGPTPLVQTSDSPLSDQLNRLLARALAKSPGERLRNAEELAEDLASLCNTLDPWHDDTSEAAPIHIADKRNATALETRWATADNTPSLPNLGFFKPLQGELEAKRCTFFWMKKRSSFQVWRERCVPAQLWVGILTISLYIAMYIPRGFSVVAAFTSLLLFGLFAPTAICAFLGAFNRLPLCRNCHLSMRRTSRWSRFASDRQEVLYGQSDCMAALKHGLWHEAAKLLSIHGREVLAEYGNNLITPARFQLAFFECDTCCDHAARLTTDLRLSSSWRQQEHYYEAYWRYPGVKSSVVHRFMNICKHALRTLVEAGRLRFDSRSMSRPLILCGVLGALVTLGLLWSAWNDHIRHAYLIEQLKQHKVCYESSPFSNREFPHRSRMKHVTLPANNAAGDFLKQFECFKTIARYSDCVMVCTPR